MSAASKLVAWRSPPVERTTAVGVIGGLVAVELVAVAAYLELTGTGLLEPRYTLYPFVWVNLSAWVLLRRPTVSASGPGSGAESGAGTGGSSRRRRAVAATLAVGYFLVLAVAGGLVRPGAMSMPLRVVWLSPGWGPAVLYGSPLVQLTVLPFEVIGYLALAALVYTVVLAGARAALAGVLGIATCVGCLWPVGAAVAAAIGGVGSPLATTVPGFAYDLSTAIFAVTATVLYLAARRAA